MRSPSPAKKTNEILNELTGYLNEGKKVNEFQFHRYVKDIENLRDPHVESSLLAFANAAYGRKSEAIAFFEKSLDESPYDYIANNYLAYIDSHGTIKEFYALLIRVAHMFESKEFSLDAIKRCVFHGDIELAREFADKCLKLCGDEERSEMEKDISDAFKNTLNFNKTAGFSSKEYALFSKIVIDTLEKHGKKFLSIFYRFIADKAVNSCTVFVNSHDINIISEMNMDIALSLADHDEFLNKNFSVWFLGKGE